MVISKLLLYLYNQIKTTEMKTVEREITISMVIRNRITFVFEILIGIMSLPMILLTMICGYEVFIEVTPYKKVKK